MRGVPFTDVAGGEQGGAERVPVEGRLATTAVETVGASGNETEMVIENKTFYNLDKKKSSEPVGYL